VRLKPFLEKVFHRKDQERSETMKQKIVPLGKDMTWIDAFHETRSKGGMPTYALHDATLQNDELRKKLKEQRFYAAWCEELIAYPQKDGVFAKEDLTDKNGNLNRYMPKKYIPKGAIGKKGIALKIFIKELKDNNTVIIPRKIDILYDFPQKDGLYDFDAKTLMPINRPPKSADYWAGRYLWRWDEQCVRPLCRYDVFDYYRRIVGAYRSPDGSRLGVGVVEPQANKEDI